MLQAGNDHPFEQPIRDAAEHYQVPSSPSWERMEKLLDEALPVERPKRRRPFFFLLTVLVLLLSVVIGYTLLTPSPEKIEGSKTVVASNTNPDPVTTHVVRSIDKTVSSEEPTVPPRKADEDLTRNPIPGSTSLTTHRKQSKLTSTLVITETKGALTDIPSISANTIQQPQSTTQLTTNVKDTTPQNTQAIAAEESSTVPTVPADSLLPVTDTTTTKTPPAAKEKARWSVGVLAGSDISTVGFDYLHKPGINLGIMAGYHLNTNVSLHAGFIYTRKQYKMNGNNFHAPANSWMSFYKLITVDGHCDMFEIPVNLRYTFGGGQKQRAFISAGLSSYLMTKEQYNYAYYFNGNPVTGGSKYNTNRNHWVAALRLTGGMEKLLSPNSGLLIEPYVNIPLRGVGLGDIRLSSMGINISWQWKQPRK